MMRSRSSEGETPTRIRERTASLARPARRGPPRGAACCRDHHGHGRPVPHRFEHRCPNLLIPRYITRATQPGAHVQIFWVAPANVDSRHVIGGGGCASGSMREGHGCRDELPSSVYRWYDYVVIYPPQIREPSCVRVLLGGYIEYKNGDRSTVHGTAGLLCTAVSSGYVMRTGSHFAEFEIIGNTYIGTPYIGIVRPMPNLDAGATANEECYYLIGETDLF